MLLQQTDINKAMTLDAAGITRALHNNDFPEDSVKTASFRGMTVIGSFMYDCTYYDTNTGKEEDCLVYVRFNNLRKLVADY